VEKSADTLITIYWKRWRRVPVRICFSYPTIWLIITPTEFLPFLTQAIRSPISKIRSPMRGSFFDRQRHLGFSNVYRPAHDVLQRSILDANGVVYPPTTWDAMISLAPTLTQKDASGQIIKSAVALGHFSNITNAKDILATLLCKLAIRLLKKQMEFLVQP